MSWPDDAHDPCVIDIEASGFGRASYPIEIGYVRADGVSMCTLVRPEPDWTHWDGGAEGVHGITRELLQRHGRPAQQVAQMLNEGLAGLVVYCDAWAHDYPWLARLFDAAQCSPAFKLESVATLLDEPRLVQLPGAQRLALSRLGLARHRASSDARALQLALRDMLAPGVAH